MSGPYDPRQMPPAPGQPEGDQPYPNWRVVDPEPGPPSGPPRPGGYTSHPGYQSYPSYPGYPGYPAGPSGPSPMPPDVPTQWGPEQQPQWGYAPPSQGGPPSGSQWGYAPTSQDGPPPGSQWGYAPPSQGGPPPGSQWQPDARGTWEGWGQGAPPPFPSQRFPELEPEEPRRPPSPLVIALGVLMVILLVAVAGAGLAYTQYRAPANAATGFCNHLTSQDYGATYEDLSTSVQAQYAPYAFVASAREADKLLGAVITCTAATSGSSYRFSLGQSSAQVPISLTRAQAGNFAEVVTLIPDRGGWRLQRLDAGLFGLDLAPLIVASVFCADLQAQSYADLYGLLDTHARGSTTQDDFVRQGALHDQIDGVVSTCDVLGVANASAPSSLSITLGVTRSRTAAEQGPVTLAKQNGVWRIDAFGGNLLGSDLGPLTVGGQFCAALVAGNYAAAYALLSDHGKGGESEQQFAYDTSGGGLITWTGCTPDYGTYKVSGGTASYTTNLQAVVTGYGINAARGFQFSFVKQGNRWLLDGVRFEY